MTSEAALPYLALIALALLAAGLFAWDARRARAALAASEKDAAGAKAKALMLESIAAERDAALARERDAAARLAASESAAAAQAEAAEARIAALTSLKDELQKNFGALAGEALAKSEERFLLLANETFQKHQVAAAGGVKQVVDPVQQAFAKLTENIEALEKRRLTDRSQLSEQMRQIGETLKETQGMTGKLVTALRAAPKTRGRWGEETLRNVLELAGLSAHVDFHEQTTVESESGKLRPDVTIRLPGGRVIVVDSKVALSGYLDAMEASDDATREACLTKHAQELRAHVRQLGGKEYWKHVPDTADFVALFIPGENFFAAALERDPQLFEDAIRLKVIITTPATMVALAKAVAYGWRQEDSARNAQEIAELGRELYRRLATMGDRLTALGNSLEKSVKSYNELVGTVESRVLPQARRFRDLGAGDDKEIGPVEQADTAPRLLAPQAELGLDEPEGPKARKRG